MYSCKIIKYCPWSIGRGIKMNDLVSIIIPIYNVEKYLTRCINSVLKQSYSNLEIILVDDGSPDNCGMICDEFAQRDNRIRVIHKQNGGLSSARNAGLEICKGEYILFLDSDDWIKNNTVECALKHIHASKADILAFSCYVVNEKKVEDDYSIIHVNVNCSEKNEAVYLLENFRDKWDKFLIVAWNKLYKRKVFRNVRFIEGVFHEDEYIITEILKNANSVFSIDVPLYYYYLSENSIMRSNNKGMYEKKIADLVQMYRIRAKCFFELGYVEQARYSFLDYICTIKKGYFELRKSNKEQLKQEMLELKLMFQNTAIKSRLTFIFKLKIKLFLYAHRLLTGN